jgi:hypothetical protein
MPPSAKPIAPSTPGLDSHFDHRRHNLYGVNTAGRLRQLKEDRNALREHSGKAANTATIVAHRHARLVPFPSMQNLVPDLKNELGRQLCHPRINRSAADNSEGRRCVRGIRIRKLRVIQDIEEFPSKLEPDSFLRPRNGH